MNFKPFDNSTKNFFDDGFIEGFNLLPDSKYTILRQGLLDYYHTYHSFSGNMYEYIHKYPNNKIESSRARGHDFSMRYFSAVSFVQIFIELYVKEILEKINPILILGTLKNNEEKGFINYICNEISRFNQPSDGKTVPFSVALKRLITLIKSDSKIPENFRVPTKFHLFAENMEMLNHFAAIRNSINHRGNQVMSRYAFELLFSNYIIPFITALLRLNPRETLLERDIFCKKNVLDELCKIKLEEDYKDASKFEYITKSLAHINHLKELGRASYNNVLHMGEDYKVDDKEKERKLAIMNERERTFNEEVAKFLQSEFNYYDIHQCPCCGANSLITYMEFSNNKITSARCLICSYKINDEIGEPKEFEIMDKEIFVYSEG
jgi:hypothetical protein